MRCDWEASGRQSLAPRCRAWGVGWSSGTLVSGLWMVDGSPTKTATASKTEKNVTTFAQQTANDHSDQVPSVGSEPRRNGD
jgi:hypothetical protein